MEIKRLLPSHSFCIYNKQSSVCNTCINRSKFKPKCENCIMFTIPIPKLCYDCMLSHGGNHRYYEEVL